MVKVVDLASDLQDVPMLENRYGHPSDEEARKSFVRLFEYRDGGISVVHFSGNSGWERHPQGDEAVQILDGATRIDIIVDQDLESHELTAGMLVVVPQGCWHRFESETGVKVMATTPRPTEHALVDDPRDGVATD